MNPRNRLALTAFCCDLALYLVMTALPFRILAMGGASWQLGLIPALYAAPYALLALAAGRFSDRSPRHRLIRLGATIAALGAAWLGLTQNATTLFLSIPILSVGLALVWPSVQAAFSELARGQQLSRAVGLYNLSWSSGKGLGFLLGGLLMDGIGAGGVHALAAASLGVAALAVPKLERPGRHVVESEDGTTRNAKTQQAFRRSAWIANGAAFGLGATLNHHLPQLFVSTGFSPSFFGLFLGLIFLTQTLSFALLSRSVAWHYARLPLGIALTVAAILALLLTRLDQAAAILACAPLLGAALGFCYQSSLYYSLHAPLDRGKQAGVHEASLGIASAAIPFLGGVVASHFELASAPFGLAAAAVLIAAILGQRWTSQPRD